VFIDFQLKCGKINELTFLYVTNAYILKLVIILFRVLAVKTSYGYIVNSCMQAQVILLRQNLVMVILNSWAGKLIDDK